MEILIWAFLNLKALKWKEKLEKFSHDFKKLKKRVEHRQKQDSFGRIHMYSIKIRPSNQTKTSK
jgi:hypothetical protein